MVNNHKCDTNIELNVAMFENPIMRNYMQNKKEN